MKKVFPYSFIAVLFLISNCFTTSPEKPQIEAPSPLSLLEKSTKEIFAPKVVTAHLNTQDGLLKITVNGPTCSDKNQFPFKFEGFLESDFGRHPFAFTGGDFASDLKLQIDQSEFSISGLTDLKEYFTQIKARFCATQTSIIAPTKEVMALISSSLEKAVPECSVSVQSEQLVCSLSKGDPQLVEKEVDEFRRTMISRWSRQPYIIARRASVAGQLAHLLRIRKDNKDDLINAQSSEIAMQKFCKLLKISVRDELPLIMASTTWKDFVCDSKNNWQKRMNVALFGLQKATDEMNILKNLYDRSSHVGLFSVRIPKNDLPKNLEGQAIQDFTVTITPDTTVFEGMASQLSSFLKKDTEDGVVSPYDLCWHPLFAQTSANFEIAKQTQILRSSSHVHCTNSKNSQSLSQESLKYLTSSLASETEFVMTNGRSRLVRLPAGRYTYKVTVLQEMTDENESEQEDVAQEHENFVVSVGQLNWEKPTRIRKIVRK